MNLFVYLCVLVLPTVCILQETDGQPGDALSNKIVFPKDRKNVPKGRIIGGIEVTPHAYPFQAALLMVYDQVVGFCGGTLILPNYVLTAAHCVSDKPHYATVILGAHDLEVEEPSDVIMNSTKFIVHERWNEETLVNDIALVKLPRSVLLSQYVDLARLATGAQTYTNEIATVVGWGKTSANSDSISEVLRNVNGRILSNEECAAANEDYQLVIGPGHVCQDGRGTGSCQGDSGGPLLVNGIQIGIVSFGYNDCLSAPSVFTRVTEYRDWIERTVNGGVSLKNVNCSITVLLVFLLVRWCDWI